MKRTKFFTTLIALVICFVIGYRTDVAIAVMLSSERIGYVDIERIFREYKTTREAKKRMEDEVEKKKKRIAELEREIEDLTLVRQKESLREPLASTGLVEEVVPSEPGFGVIVTGEEAVQRKIEELKATISAMEKELAEVEKEITRQIMGKIYDVIKEIAREQGYAIILDKKNILYSELENDLTEQVLKRLNSGR